MGLAFVCATLFWAHSSAHYANVMNELAWGFDDLWIELVQYYLYN